MMGLRRMIRTILNSNRGTSVIELGISLPIIILLVTGGTDVALAFSAKLALQQSATRTIEKATAGGLNSTAFNLLREEAAAAAGVPLSQVVLDKWVECDGTRQSSFTTECTGSQQVGRYVSITINGSYVPMFSVLPGTGSIRSIALVGRSSVRVQ